MSSRLASSHRQQRWYDSKSLCGIQDFFSPNSLLDANSASSSNSSSFMDPANPTPTSRFSFHPHNHGVLDRYDFFSPYMPTDVSRQVWVIHITRFLIRYGS